MEHIALKLGFEPLFLFYGRLSTGIEHVAQETVPHAGRTKDVKVYRIKQPQLVLGATRRYIKSLTSRFRCERTDSFIWRSNHAKKHYLTLISLERIGIAADQATLLNNLWFQ